MPTEYRPMPVAPRPLSPENVANFFRSYNSRPLGPWTGGYTSTVAPAPSAENAMPKTVKKPHKARSFGSWISNLEAREARAEVRKEAPKKATKPRVRKKAVSHPFDTTLIAAADIASVPVREHLNTWAMAQMVIVDDIGV